MSFQATVFAAGQDRCGCCRARVETVCEATGWVNMGGQHIPATVPICAVCAEALKPKLNATSARTGVSLADGALPVSYTPSERRAGIEPATPATL